ncbi:MAG: FadR/GntR family transcriptional regulator [Alcaligenaceae bacterium]|nr:FadR/GntR family transcriptional regulator [Alcaligenaceae bacterium]
MSTDGLKPVKRRASLADDVADALRERLLRGDFKAGDRLPTGSELSAAFSVSLAVIREAMSRLKHDGLVETIQGAGVFATGTGGSKTFRLDADGGGQEALKHIFELRLAFEEGAAYLAASRRTPRTLRGLRKAFELMHADDPGAGAAADKEFHRLIAGATGNPLFLEFFDFLAARIDSTIFIARAHSAEAGVSAEALEEHREILRAIEARDGAAAKAAMFRHLNNAAARLRL